MNFKKQLYVLSFALFLSILLKIIVYKSKEKQNCVALYGDFGQTFNKIIQLYKTFKYIERNNIDYIVLDDYYSVKGGETWFKWYKNFMGDTEYLDQRIRPGRTGRLYPLFNTCKEYVHVETIFFADEPEMDDYYLWDEFLPNGYHFNEAYNFITMNIEKKFVSVHGRNFEGNCEFFVRKYSNKSHPEWYCQLTSEIVEKEMKPKLGLENYETLLLSDGQRPDLDETFEFQYSGSFESSVWIMVLSDYHIGNTASTVDFVVSKWRRNKNTNFNLEI